MGLFKKKANQQSEEPNIINVKCPKCSQTHELTLYDTKYLLDGTPALPMTKLLERIHICNRSNIAQTQHDVTNGEKNTFTQNDQYSRDMFDIEER